MFDLKASIVVPLPGPEGHKIEVSYPSDQQWIEWRRKKKVTQKDLGRRSFQIESAQPSTMDLQLINSVMQDKENAPKIDEAEAYYILQRLMACECNSNPEREGSSYVIKLKVMGKLMTEHKLAIPTVKQMMDYERMRSSVTFGQYGQQEIRINFQAASDLYDALKVSTVGYKGDVPVPHKAEAVNVFLQELRADQEEAPGEDEDRD